MVFAFYFYFVEFAADEFPGHIVIGALADHDLNLILLGDSFEARGEVHVIAHDRPGQAFFRAHVAHVDRARVETDADGDGRAIFLIPFFVEPHERLRHFERAVASGLRVIALRVGRAPEGHDRVADVFIERAKIGEEDVRHCTEIFVEQADELVGGEALGNGGESADVAEHNRQFFRFAAGMNVFLWIFFDQADDAGRKILREAFADFALFALLENHAKAGDGGVVRGERTGRKHEAEPAPLAREGKIDEPAESGEREQHGDRGP